MLPRRLGAYVLLSAMTCVALDIVSGPQQVARLPDPKQLEEVRAAAEKRKSMAQLQLQRAAERALRRKSATSLGKRQENARQTAPTIVHVLPRCGNV